jgi:hypothetical protein
MKLIVVLALFGLAFADPEAKPEADPYFYYNTLGYGGYHPYTYGYGHHLGYTLPVVKPAETEEVAEVKEAAEPKAPVVTYAHPYAYGGVYPYHYGYTHTPVTYTVPTVAHAAYTVPRYYANSAGVVHAVAKREAEAEPEAEADPKSWYGYYGYPYAYRGYGYGHYPYAYSGYYGRRWGYGGYGGYGYYG